MRDAESSIRTLNLLTRGISDVLDIARLNQDIFALNPVSMNLRAIVEDAVTACDAGPIPLSIQSSPEIILTADPQRICQAVETMLTYVANLSLKPTAIIADISTEKRADGPWILLSIKARGSAQHDLSERSLYLFALNSRSTQLGVQLYLANQIALAHHGTLTIASVAGQEIRLTLAFPVEDEELLVRGDPLFPLE